MNQSTIKIRLDILGEKYKERNESSVECVLEEKDEKELLSFLNCHNEIIRASAVDLLAYSNTITTRDTLMNLITKDNSRIVRAYCCSSLCDIAFERKENGYIMFQTQIKST